MVRNLSVSKRNFLGFGVVTLIVLLLGVLALVQLGRVHGALSEVKDVWLLGTRLLGEIEMEQAAVRRYELRSLVLLDEADLRSTVEKVKAVRERITAAEAKYESTIVDDTDRRLFSRYQTLSAQYRQLADHMFSLLASKQNAEAFQLGMGPSFKAYTDMHSVLEELIALNSDGAAAAGKRADDVVTSTYWEVLLLMLLAIMVTVVVAIRLSRSVTVPLQAAVRVAKQIAAGDLRARLDVDGRDELTQLQQALVDMQDNLQSMLRQIQDSAQQLASAAEQLSAVTEQTAVGIQRQNDEIQMAASAVTEMSAAVDEVARNANQTSAASRQTEATAGVGQQQVRQTAQAIDRLTANVTQTGDSIKSLAQQASEIGRVLDVIRGIADQTNLLALNAAIEAARAGEQGRGFSVVADEVRALAQRTQASTREIEQMIAAIQQGTQGAVSAMAQSSEQASGSRALAEAADGALADITQMVSRINEMNLTIASAAEEQANVAREVDKNLVAIRDIAAQTATGAQQTSSASLELTRLASALNQTVVRFQLR
ncbi:MAG: methyl-accepting chemotaxis protein [Pseudomonadota bacterium]